VTLPLVAKLPLAPRTKTAGIGQRRQSAAATALSNDQRDLVIIRSSKSGVAQTERLSEKMTLFASIDYAAQSRNQVWRAGICETGWVIIEP